MQLIKFNPARAEKLGNALSAISTRAEVFGYLTGLIQDVARCITANVKSDVSMSDVDAKLVDEIIETLKEAESNISCFMSEAIKDGDTGKD